MIAKAQIFIFSIALVSKTLTVSQNDVGSYFNIALVPQTSAIPQNDIGNCYSGLSCVSCLKACSIFVYYST